MIIIKYQVHFLFYFRLIPVIAAEKCSHIKDLWENMKDDTKVKNHLPVTNALTELLAFRRYMLIKNFIIKYDNTNLPFQTIKNFKIIIIYMVLSIHR